MLERLRRLLNLDGRSVLRRKWWDHLTDTHLRWMRVVVTILSSIMLLWLFPRESTSEFSGWREGMVAPREVIAPFSFNVRTGDVELARARSRVSVAVAPVVRPVADVDKDQKKRASSFLQRMYELSQDPTAAMPDTALPLPREQIHESTIQWLMNQENIGLARSIAPAVLTRVYQNGVLSVDEVGEIRDYFERRGRALEDEVLPEQIMLVPDAGDEQPISFTLYTSVDDVQDNLGELVTRQALSSGDPLSPEALRALHNVIGSAVVPNRYYDRNETIQRQTQASANVALYKRTIFKDERFIQSHQVLTTDDIDELRSLMEALQQRQRQVAQWQEWALWMGRSTIIGAILVILGLFLRQFHLNVWRRPDWLFLCILLVWLPLTIASYAATNASISAYVIPLPLTAMLGAVLFGPQLAFALAAATLLIAGALLGFDFQMVFVNAVASSVAVFSVQSVRNRNQFLRAMVFLPLGIVASITALDAMQGTSGSAIWGHIWPPPPPPPPPGAVNGIAVPVLSMGLLVVFEKLFGVTTGITLLELSDLNSPILRELAIRAPGTYTHSLIIANLAERGADAVGANPLLTRVGAYYHDLGKMSRPDHFVENQLYKGNPHDRLAPQMSALVVAAHVKDGIQTAEQIGLPTQIIDFIPQHHGTMLIKYFYHKAKEQYGEENVQEEVYRYPGPKPQTKEAAILMMADAVEAAVRSLRERTPSRIQGMVHTLVRDRLDDGQFDECDMTLRDLSRVEAAFLPVLAGTLHERIEYPKDSTPSPAVEDIATDDTPISTDDARIVETGETTDRMPDQDPAETM